MLPGYTHRTKISVDPINITGDLIDFPVAVVLRNANFDFAGSLANGHDIRFTAADGVTLLDFERDRHDSVTGLAEYQVKVPAVSSVAPTEIYLYQRTTATVDGANPTAVWGAATKGRWGLGQNPAGGAGAMIDSSINANHGTAHGMTSANSVEGDFSRALDFDGVDDHVNAGNDASLGIAHTLTITLWAKLTGVVGQHNTFIVSKKNTAWSQSAGYQVYYSPFSNGIIDMMAGDRYYKRHTILQDNLWHHYAMVWEGTTLSLYQDGILQSGSYIGTPTAVISGTDNLWINRRDDAATSYAKGISDEVHINSIARSSAWIKASHHSGNNTLLTFGGVEQILQTKLNAVSAIRTNLAGSGLLQTKLNAVSAIRANLADIAWATYIRAKRRTFTIDNRRRTFTIDNRRRTFTIDNH